MIQEYILDSNILIYYLKKDKKIRNTLTKLNREYFFLSTITHVEVLEGAKDKKDFKMIQEMLNRFVPLDFKRETAVAAIQLKMASSKKLKFKDLLIAATALVEGLTMVTADKDFKGIPGLKLKLLS